MNCQYPGCGRQATPDGLLCKRCRAFVDSGALDRKTVVGPTSPRTKATMDTPDFTRVLAARLTAEDARGLLEQAAPGELIPLADWLIEHCPNLEKVVHAAVGEFARNEDLPAAAAPAAPPPLCKLIEAARGLAGLLEHAPACEHGSSRPTCIQRQQGMRPTNPEELPFPRRFAALDDRDLCFACRAFRHASMTVERHGGRRLTGSRGLTASTKVGDLVAPQRRRRPSIRAIRAMGGAGGGRHDRCGWRPSCFSQGWSCWV